MFESQAVFSKLIEKAIKFEENKPTLTLDNIKWVTGIEFQVVGACAVGTIGKTNLRVPIKDGQMKLKKIFSKIEETGELLKTRGDGNKLRKFMSDCLK